MLCFARINFSGQPFEGFLRAQFKNKPGESKIVDGNFHIIDDDRGVVVNKDDWNRSISPGAILAMSIVMTYIQGKPGRFPRPECSGVAMRSSGNSDLMKWYVG